jgi:hypothetical protein
METETNFGPQAPVLPGLKVVGKINLPKKSFKPFSGGYTLGEVVKAQKIRLN